MNTDSQVTAAPGNTLKDILLQSIRNFIIGVIVLAALLFLLAGTVDYWQAWIFTILFNAGLVTQVIYLFVMDPALLERRKNLAPAGESRGQKVVLIVGLLSIVGLLIVSPLDYRFGWSQMSLAVSLFGDGLVALSFVIYYFVFRENSFAASSVQIFENQKVISTGPYAFVRHPKYVGDLFLAAGIPLALGSWWGLAFLVVAVVSLAWRILDEEKLLRHDLPGYSAYMNEVRYRLVPYIW